MLIQRSISHSSIAAVVIALLTVVTANPGFSQQSTTGSTANDSGELHMLVLGDSIMWGQGLKERDKFWWRIKSWLQEKTERRVHEKIEAHSGAAIEAPPGAELPFASKDAEVNLLTPSINEQVDDALKYYDDPAKVDLILVDGCVNDVGVRNLLDVSTSLDFLDTNIREKCGGRMQSLLHRIVTRFPRAYVVVTGYYRIVSPETENNSFTRLFAKKLTTMKPEANKMSDKEMRARLVTISEKWYRLSTLTLAHAVEAVNADLRKIESRQRVVFAEIEFEPEHAFAAPGTLLWNFKFGSTNLSGLRKAIVALTFGTAAYKPDDEMRERRSMSCKKTYKAPGKGRKETKAEKERREFSYVACRYASLGHPNKMGALVYAEAIKGRLRWLIAEAGWLRPSASLQHLPAN